MKIFRSVALILVVAGTQAFGDHIYRVTRLTSDQPNVARHFDASLVNPWGLTVRPRGKILIANHGTEVARLYARSGRAGGRLIEMPGAPTGLVENFGQDFFIAEDAPAKVIFVTETGLIAGWNPDLDPTHAVAIIENPGAAYTGVTRARLGGSDFLYVANLAAGVVEMYDSNFEFVKFITDPTLPAGFAPFNVRNIRRKLFVTYINPNLTGAGNGVVNVFDLDGTFVRRFASGGSLNKPWGIVRAPHRFGIFSDSILIANAGSGHILAFNPDNGNFRGRLRNRNGDPIEIAGLRGLAFGVRRAALADPFGCFCDEVTLPVLFFTAAPEDGAHGLFGRIRPDFFRVR